MATRSAASSASVRSSGRSRHTLMREEIDNVVMQVTRLKTNAIEIEQHARITEGRLRNRINVLETELRTAQQNVDRLRGENEDLKRAAREHVCSARAQPPSDSRSWQNEREAMRRQLRRLTSVLHDLSGRLADHEPSESREDSIPTPRTNTPPSVHSDTPIEGDLSQEHSSLLSSVVLEPQEAPPVRTSDATRQSIGTRDPEVLVEDEPEPEADRGVNGTDTMGDSAPAGVRLPARHEAIAMALSGLVSTDTPAERQSEVAVPLGSVTGSWLWRYADIPAVSAVRCGPISIGALARAVNAQETIIADWVPVPSCRSVVSGDILLYHYPTFLDSTAPESRRTILVNWGSKKANRTEHKTIWPTGNCAAYHTFVLTGKPDEMREWWYIGKLQWARTKHIPVWPVDDQLQHEVAVHLQDKWSFDSGPEEIIELIHSDESLIQMTIELTNSSAFAEESRRFVEDNLQEESVYDNAVEGDNEEP